MKHSPLFLFLAINMLLISANLQAHGRWLLPSHFNLSGNNPHTITVDMSISNELFHPDHGFIPVADINKYPKGVAPATLKMFAPKGQHSENLPFQYLIRKSVGSIPLLDTGTYHLYLAQSPTEFRTFRYPDGKHGKEFNPHTSLPPKVTEVKKVRMLPTINSYVSRNEMTSPVLINQGLELANGQHPNDLFVGETSKFQVLLNGYPISTPINLQIVRGATRYRNDREVTIVTTDKQGWFSISWLKPGAYLIEAELEVDLNNDVNITQYALYTTLEVNPE